MSIRHFLSLSDMTPDEIRHIIDRAVKLKADLQSGIVNSIMENKTAVLVFEQLSTRTRVSFEIGISQFGGKSIFLSICDSQISRGERIEDTARVLSRMANVIIMRTGDHNRVQLMAEYSSVPVINALSAFNHPCQQLADIQTFMEHRGDICGRKVAWIGDGNNVCHSWMNSARLLEFELQIATPPGYEPDNKLLNKGRDYINLSHSPKDAAKHADLIVTDSWWSMGQEENKQARKADFLEFRVNNELMSLAKSNALFMHCLPAYRGYEVSNEVIDGPQSVVWDEAENRLHAQKALIEFLLCIN